MISRAGRADDFSGDVRVLRKEHLPLRRSSDWSSLGFGTFSRSTFSPRLPPRKGAAVKVLIPCAEKVKSPRQAFPWLSSAWIRILVSVSLLCGEWETAEGFFQEKTLAPPESRGTVVTMRMTVIGSQKPLKWRRSGYVHDSQITWWLWAREIPIIRPASNLRSFSGGIPSKITRWECQSLSINQIIVENA